MGIISYIMQANVPILLITYNRPDHVRQALDRLKDVHPSVLYVFCDGPKKKNDFSVKKVHEIVNSCDWITKRCISVKNLGCKEGVKSAIDWIFSEQERAIILEDDVEVHESFFSFAEEMLSRYANDDRIGMITGVNLLNYGSFPEYSYFFSKHAAVWGWATWKRSWEYYHKTEKLLEKVQKQKGLKALLSKIQAKEKIQLASKSVEGSIDTWDFIWNASFELFERLCVFPMTNLVVNHGFGEAATHTKLKTNLSRLKLNKIVSPLRHPEILCSDSQYDKKIYLSQKRGHLIYQVLRHHVLGI